MGRQVVVGRFTTEVVTGMPETPVSHGMAEVAVTNEVMVTVVRGSSGM